MKAQLEVEEKTITYLEAQIKSEEEELKELEKLLDRYDSLGYISKYNEIVYEFNDLLEIYENDICTYNEKLEDYNRKVDKVNALIDKSGKRWILIPIPLPIKSRR